MIYLSLRYYDLLKELELFFDALINLKLNCTVSISISLSINNFLNEFEKLELKKKKKTIPIYILLAVVPSEIRLSYKIWELYHRDGVIEFQEKERDTIKTIGRRKRCIRFQFPGVCTKFRN